MKLWFGGCVWVGSAVCRVQVGGPGTGRRSCQLRIGEGVGGGHASNRLGWYHRV